MANIPAWLHAQPVKLLKVYFNSFVDRGPESLDTTNLLCSHLELYCREFQDVSEICVKWLLNMPLLKHLSIRVDTDVMAELLVIGSLRPWCALLAKTKVHVIGAVEVAETDCSEEFRKRVALRQKGHWLMCLCTSCKDQHLDCQEQPPIDGQMDDDPSFDRLVIWQSPCKGCSYSTRPCHPSTTRHARQGCWCASSHMSRQHGTHM